MRLLALDKNFTPVRYLQAFHVQWDREYYGCGEFSLQMAAAGYTPEMAYLYTKDRPETGIIQKVRQEGTVKGEFVELSGYFLERILNDKIVYPTFYATGNLELACRQLLEQYKEDIPLLQLPAAPAGLGQDTVWQELGGCLGDVLAERLEAQELGLRCALDYENGRILAQVWQGRDRTQSQGQNNFVVFSSGFKNIEKLQLDRDLSNYKNWALVQGKGVGDELIQQEVDLSAGGYKRKVFFESTKRFDPKKQTLQEFKEGLYQFGLEKLTSKYGQSTNIELDVSPASGRGFAYLRDFDLGDKVDVVLNRLGLALECRIVSVHEVWKKGAHTVSIELGNKVLTDFEKARLA